MSFHAGLAIGAGPIEPNVQQFVQWISVRQPRGSFLLRTEQIAMFIERERDWEADPRADGLTLAEVSRHLLNGAAIRIDVVLADSLVIDQISVGIVDGAQTEIDAAIFIHGDANGVDVLGNLLPSRGDDDLFVRFVIAVRVDD